MPLFRPDRPGDLDLAAGRVDRHQRAFQLQDRQQLGDGGDLVGPVGDRLLAQDQVALPGPGTDQVQAAAERGAGGRPHRLAVDGHRPQTGRGTQPSRPPAEAGRERRAVQGGQHPVERVVAGDAVGQLQEPPQPVELGLAEPLDLFETVRPGDDRADGDHQNVGEPVFFGPIHPRVGQVGERIDERDLRPAHDRNAPWFQPVYGRRLSTASVTA